MKSLQLKIVILGLILIQMEAFSATFYWRGGTGNWSDITKWSTSATSFVNPAAQPSNTDDVIIDASSATGTITVTTGATCRDFNSTNCPSGLTLSLTNNLTLAGSNIIFATNLGISGAATIFFSGISNINIDFGSAAKSFGNVTFSGTPTADRNINLNCNNAGDKTFGVFTCKVNSWYNILKINGGCNKTFGALDIGPGSWWPGDGFAVSTFTGPITVSGNTTIGEISNIAFNGTSTFNGSCTFGGQLLIGFNGGTNTFNGAVVYTGVVWNGQHSGTTVFNSTFTVNDNTPGNFSTYMFLGNISFNSSVTVGNENQLLVIDRPAYIKGNVSLGTNCILTAFLGIDCSSAPTTATFSIGDNSRVTSSGYNYSQPYPNSWVNCNNIFRNVSLAKGARLRLNGGTGTTTIQDLSLAQWSYVELNPNGPNNITGNVTTTATCGGRVYIRSAVAPNQAFITLSNPISISNIVAEDLSITGSLTIMDGVNLGNNTNITFAGSTSTIASPQIFYWTGGIASNTKTGANSTGNNVNWDNPANWTKVLDASSNPVPSTTNSCVPAPTDHVVFTGSSFAGGSKDIELPTEIRTFYCNNLIFTSDVPTGVRFDPAGNNRQNELIILGNLTFSNNVTNSYEGVVTFASPTSGKTISTTAGGTINFLNAVEFDNAAGSWDLQCNLDLIGVRNGTLSIFNGELRANSYTISLDGDWCQSNLPTAIFRAGTSTVRFDATGDHPQNIFCNKNSPSLTYEFYNLVISRPVVTNYKVMVGRDNGSYFYGTPSYPTVTNVFTLQGGHLDLNANEFTITNPATSAVVRTGGYVYSENTSNLSKMTWMINSTTGTHIFPFGKDYSNYIPFTFDLTTGNIGNVTLSTYSTATDNTPYPTLPDAVNSSSFSSNTDNTSNMVDRFWQIDKTSTDANARATITFTYPNDEIPSGGEAGLKPIRYSSNLSKWVVPQNTPTQNLAANTVTVSGVGTFSPWTLVLPVSPLPVKFVEFSANRLDKECLLKWSTSNELNCNSFEIQRSVDGKLFTTIGIAHPIKNSSNFNQYSFIDEQPLGGVSYYRIAAIEEGNTISYSSMKSLVFEINNSIFSVSPNPTTNNNINIYFQELGSGTVTLKIFNMLGREVFSINYETENGRLNTQLNVASQLEQGPYMIEIISGSKEYKNKLIINN